MASVEVHYKFLVEVADVHSPPQRRDRVAIAAAVEALVQGSDWTYDALEWAEVV
jgi:hypothetical protein